MEVIQPPKSLYRYNTTSEEFSFPEALDFGHHCELEPPGAVAELLDLTEAPVRSRI